MNGQQVSTETSRDRVRRMVITPLADSGFRFKRGTPDEQQRKVLDRMADALGYMSDRGLSALQATLATKGEGSAKCFWPCMATVIGCAEAFEPRPLEELPAVARWFGSQAGIEAARAGRLVAEYEFWRRKKRPPMNVQERKVVSDRAATWSARADRVRDRIDRGFAPFGDDGEWLRWYDATKARAAALVGKAGRVE
ncbi:hypothetical protein J7426_23515 [Tropicibacter sp. R16_0]|uniref:hypothetical protein n=1 Tax=Tropicibacter sp. R16_0 TaxID=2821102 RepID=UPI001ADD2F69|nr:hypothetical protein [Tropicibacter sp. R16_0]MBO9453250.1 hypothetical protein [Tropicibacter sp. R16_0]